MAEDRLAVLESTVNEHSVTLAALRESMVRVEQRLDRVEQRMDAGFDRVEARFQHVDARFERLETRFDRLEDRLFRTLMWVVGIQVTVMLVVVGSVVSIALTAPR